MKILSNKHFIFPLWIVLMAVLVVVILLFVNFSHSGSRLIGLKVKTVEQLVMDIKAADFQKKDWADCLAQAEPLVKKYPNSIDAWDLKGVCEFQLGKLDAAKKSFETVLAASSTDQIALSYQKLFVDRDSGIALLTANTQGVSRSDFEAGLGVRFDPSYMLFGLAFPVQSPSGSPFGQMYSGSYVGQKPYADIMKYLKTKFIGKSVRITTTKFGSYIESAATSSFTYGISVFANVASGTSTKKNATSSVGISIIYGRK
jgi:hypothetical protein